MNSEIRKLLESVQAGKTSVDDAMLELKKAPFEDIGYAKVDLHRKVRQGAAEVIYGAGKTPEQIGGIIDAMRANGQNRVLITRMSPEAAAHVGSTRELDYHKDARGGHCGWTAPARRHRESRHRHRRHQRHPRGRGGGADGTGAGQRGGAAVRRGRVRRPPAACPYGFYYGSQRGHRHRGHGGGSCRAWWAVSRNAR